MKKTFLIAQLAFSLYGYVSTVTNDTDCSFEMAFLSGPGIPAYFAMTSRFVPGKTIQFCRHAPGDAVEFKLVNGSSEFSCVLPKYKSSFDLSELLFAKKKAGG